jgi:Mycothiol maleylpyruvate isomerase N-terminal domain
VNPTQEQFLAAAGAAVALLHDPAVAAAWDRPSVLAGFGVSGLAGHLARQILLVPRLLAQPVPDGAPLSLLEHYAAVPWAAAGPAQPAAGPGSKTAQDKEPDPVITGGEAEAAIGPAALATSAAAATTALTAALPAEPPGRLVHLPWGPWSLSLGDFLVTRMMEITVHSDDLALSADVPTPALPQPVTGTVLGLLVQLSARKHGPTAVLRALSRAERAPATIAAF